MCDRAISHAGLPSHALPRTTLHGRSIGQTSSKMSIADVDQSRVVQLLLRDLHATVGTSHDYLAKDNAVRCRQFIDDVTIYCQRVVDDTQQDIHDEFIDTVWPQCPRHAHPLWFRDDWWWCERDGHRVAPLGQLKPKSDGP